MKMLEANEIIKVPQEIATCPYCGEKLIASCDQWSENSDLTWEASHLLVECLSEPEMEENIKAWREWLALHSEMPYVYMLPVEQKVLRWINRNFRWKVGDASEQIAEPEQNRPPQFYNYDISARAVLPG